ncbi:MAG: single-stranded-DNA-specific exonuclease RecJ, partial [Eggerthellaceae bacterium]|nr:single-stranded-DNA-specific exonuclease RecJ [Eggerthellaceae bacterium]
MPAQFNIRAADPARTAELQQALGLPRFIAATLVARGITDVGQARAFLSPSLDRDWLDPYDIPGLRAVADLLEQALRDHRHIVVFGDFDLDGISATTVLTRGLRALGGRATPFIPRRFEEGYSITPAAYERVRELAPDVIVTVDCGISCRDEVAAIVADGVSVAITDHHEAGDLVPQGVPVADPKLDDRCDSAILAGVGVALKLVQVLGGRFGYPHLWRSYTDLATLGTVADLMPMRGENRALVADGLARMNANPRPCVAALMGACGSTGPLTATNLSFSLIPRLNAAGRMGDASLALDLLMSDNFSEACLLAERLEEVNAQRRAIEAELSETAKAQAAEAYHGQRALVVAGEGWHEGVKGIVASRLVGMYGVPTLLFTVDGDEARGSGRSVGAVNLFAAVESASDLLTRFGGHEAAVGVTLPTANLGAFAERLAAYMDALPEDAFHPRVDVDACVDLAELTLPAVEALDVLAPFGQENPVPTYLARNVCLTNCRAVGADKNHFSCTLSDGRCAVNGIMFHCPSIDALLGTECVVDAAFSVQVDEWRGRRSVKAMLDTLAPARTCCALTACLDPRAQSFVDDLYGAADDGSGPSRDAARRPHGACERLGERLAERERWEALAAADPEALERALVAAIIGDRELHPSQREILDRLRAGQSTLAVMATGRGKSLTFQVYAALRALTAHEASLFVYPLRALIADQAFHLTAALERFGLVCAVLTGESAPEDRERVYRGLASGSVDIVLTTPEYLAFHVDELAAAGRIGFVVVDEAHHIGQAKAGQRVAYTQLGMAIARLGAPVVLAVTATAPDEVARDIDSTLPVTESVIDETARDNL